MKQNILTNIRVWAIMIVCLTMFGVGNAWGDATCTLSNTNIVNGTTAADGYGSKSATDDCDNTWNAYAIKKYHSNATTDWHFLQIRGYNNSTAYYIQVPEMPGTIKSIEMVVSSTNTTHNGGGNTANLYFSSSNDNRTAATGAAANPATAVSGTGASSVTLDCEDLELTTGYITASAGVRIWGDIVVTYSTGYAVTYNNGGHGSAPSNTMASSVTLSAITGVTGWTCTGWKANVATTVGGNTVAANTLIANSSTVTLSQATTFTAQWSANQYTVTLNDNTGTGGSGSKMVTYDSNTNLTTSVAVPSKSHHDFAGYWTSTDNGATFGTKLVNADGSWVASAGGGSTYTDGSKNWKYDGSITLYAKWTEHGLKNYRTTCCTELGKISGTVALGQLASPNPTKLKATWTMTASTGIASYTLEVYDNSDNLVKTINNYTSGDEITDLDPCTTYYVKLYTVSSGSPYCDGGLISTSSTCTTNSWTVDKSGVTNVTAASLSAIPATTCASGFGPITIAAADGYALPTSITVSGASSNWNQATGALTISSVTGNVTITITPTCVAPIFGTDLSTTPVNYLKDAAATALAVAATASGATINYQWQKSSDNSNWTNDGTNAPANTSYTPSTASGGTMYYRCVATNAACGSTTNSATATIIVTVPSCTDYSFHTKNSSSAWNADPICFSQVGDSHLWRTEELALPTDGVSFKVGWRGGDSWDNARTNEKDWQYMVVGPSATRLGGGYWSVGSHLTAGNTGGALGYFYVYDNSSDDNKYVGFTPSGYVLRWGTDGNGWTSKAFIPDDENDIDEVDWNTELVTWSSSNAADHLYVGLKTSSSYVWTNHSEEQRVIFLTPGVWAQDNCKFGLWDKTHLTWRGFMQDADGDGVYEGTVPSSCTEVTFARFDNAKTEPIWDQQYNKSSDQTISSLTANNMFTVTGWGDGTYCAGNWDTVYERFGVFHINAGSNLHNWDCLFVPHNVLTYDKNNVGASGTMSVQSVAVNAASNSVSVAANGFDAPTGYHFDHWDAAPDGSGSDYAPNDSYTLSADATLYAIWAPNTNTPYVVKHYKQNLAGDGYDLADTDNLTGTTATSVTPDRKDYSGFTAPAGQTVTIAVDGSLEVTYNYTRNSYNLTWALDGGSISSAGTSAGSVKYGASLTAPTVTKTGYTFASWSPAVPAAMPAGEATYTAQWSANSYDVTLKANTGGGADQVVSATYDAEMPTTLKGGGGAVTVHTKSGYTLLGYWDDASAGNQYYSYNAGTSTLSSFRTWNKTAATNLFAHWQVNNYRITLDNEGADSGHEGTGSIDVTYDANTNLTGTITKPERDGYLFGGYFVGDDGTGTQIIDAEGNVIASVASYTSATKQWIYANNITLHAKWTQVYTVTWSVNGETWSSGVVDGNTYVVNGQRVSALPTAPTKSDCDDSKVFVGWRATAIAGTSASDPGGIFTTKDGSPAIDADKTFYAVFADVSGGDFTRVTNVSQLSAGKKVILGYEATANSGVIIPIQSSALNSTLLYTGTTEGSAGYGTLTISSMSAGDEAIYAFTIRAGHNSGYWAFEMSGDNAGKYLSHRGATNGKNSITSAESITSDGMTDFSIVVGTNDVATITNKWGNENTSKDGSNNYNYKILSYNYNNGNPRAAIYRATQTGDFVMYLCNPLTYSNYVTTCSSCNADATFTNTTPAVSEIGCTSATLTATGGLATVGADGCHVSDYGFVIGTSDNPVIGGSGVTKLQVGTSDPTIGEDFSYDATGLTKGTRYYIRAYAINRHGTAYSSSTNFWTKNVSSIAITTAPRKTNYIVGETFDATGMVVTATMASGATEDVTSDVTYSSSALTAGTSQNFAINYSLCETAKSVNQVINVYTLTVTEGANPSYGTATNSSANIVSITGLYDHKTYTVTVTSSNATAEDNGDNTWSIINPTDNVTVRVDYADPVPVKVYFKVDGVTVTDLTQDVYQSETTTLPSASELAAAMTAQGMEMPDDTYPNFIGWSETEFPAQTAEPSLVTGTPTINAEKTYYAVFTNLTKKSILPTDFAGSYATNEGEKTIDGEKYQVHDICLQSSMIQFRSTPGYLYTIDALAYIKKVEITGLNLVVNACSDNAGTVDGSAITPTGTAPYVYTFPASKSYAKITGKGGTDKVSRIDIYYASSTVYYMTQFCTRYGITGASTSGTDVIVDTYTAGRLTSNYNSACEGKSIQLEAHVNSGYEFGTWTIKKTDDPTQDVTSALLPGDNASSLTPDAFIMPAYAITVSASITEKEVTGWTWKQELADASEIDIPATVQLYVGQQARFNLKAYEPAEVLNKKKGYDASYTGADLAQDNKAGAYYVTRAKIVKESTTLTFTSTNEEVQEVITIRIKALPLVHFVDLIHGETFADVVANVDASEKRTVYTTKPTPTHAADVSDPGENYNTCERQHLHLIGWIESEWAEAHPNAEPGEITGAGAGNYYAAGANIDLATQDGKTFYAVWSKIE